MEETLYCHGDHPCKVWNLPTKRGRWKKLFFLDECPICGHTVASLQLCNNDGMLRILLRKTDKEAIKLRDKLTKYAFKSFSTKKGTFSNQLIFYNNRGIIYNFNDYKVGENKDFCRVL